MEVHHDSLLRSYSLPNLASSCPCLLHHRHHPCPHVTQAETSRQNRTTVTSSGRKNLNNKENNNSGDKKQEEQEVSFDTENQKKKKKKKRLIPSCLPLHASPLVSSSSLQPSPVSVVSLQKEQVLQEQYNNHLTSVNLFSHLNFLQDEGEEEGKHPEGNSLPLESRDVSTRESGIPSTSSTSFSSCTEGNNNYCNVCCHSMRKSSLQSTMKMMKQVHPQDFTEEDQEVNRKQRRRSHEEESKQEKEEENEAEPAIVILDKQEDEMDSEMKSDEAGCRCSCNTSISTCIEGTQHTHHHHNRLQKILQRTHGQQHHHQQQQMQSDSLRQSFISLLKTSSLVSRSKEVWMSSPDKDRHRRASRDASLVEQSLMRPSTSSPDSVPTTQDEALLDSQEDSSDSDSDDYDNDDDFQELYFPDDLILKELSEMRFLLKTLLEQNLELARITLPLTSTDDILSTVLGLTSSSLSGNLGASLASSRATNAILFPDFAESNQASSSHDGQVYFHHPHLLPSSGSLTSLQTMDSSISLNERLLQHQQRLQAATAGSGDALILLKEPTPHFPVGSYGLFECGICFTSSWMYKRACCSFPSCSDCLSSYFEAKLDLGIVSIECVNSSCKKFVHRDEISVRLPQSRKESYYRLLANSNGDELSKTCPSCNHIHRLDSLSTLKDMKKQAIKDPTSVRVECSQCSYLWCFPCSSPWHEGLSCKQYIKGDRLLYDWARQVCQGQVNAQRCPKCKVLIQKSSGCDHMHCIRCKTDFCYRCGDTLRRLKFFGDHYSKLSVFGCKYRYKASQPVQRKLIRGAVFGSKLMMAPVLGSLALVAGAVVIGVGVAALPLYGGLKLYRRYQHLMSLDKTSSPSSSVPYDRQSQGSSSAFTRSRSFIGGKLDVVSTGAQTLQITFIGDNYVDVDDFVFDTASGSGGGGPSDITADVTDEASVTSF